MPTMSIVTGFVRRTDAMCDGNVVKSLKHVMVCTTESARNVKHILVQSQTGDLVGLQLLDDRKL